jgi:hypothetical protein
MSGVPSSIIDLLLSFVWFCVDEREAEILCSLAVR